MLRAPGSRGRSALSFDNAIAAMRKGVLFDYRHKPLENLSLLEVAVARALEVRKLRARAREADQVAAIREMAVTASDRILNPLNIIVLSLERLTGEEVTAEAKAKVMANIERLLGLSPGSSNRCVLWRGTRLARSSPVSGRLISIKPPLRPRMRTKTDAMHEVSREEISFQVLSARFRTGFIPKPIDTKTFLQTISTFLDRGKAQ